MDAVHRVVGLCGIVLVGEGEPRRVRPLIAQQKKRLDRISGGVPIYEMMAGEGEDQVPISKLQRELMKLPRNMKKDDVYALAARLESGRQHAEGAHAQECEYGRDEPPGSSGRRAQQTRLESI